MALNSNIVLYDEARYVNTKASEEYVHVKFKYPDVQSEWDGWVPVEYRRTGVSIPVSAKKNWKNILIIFTVKCIQLIIKHGWQSKIATGMQPDLLKQKISLTSLRMENGTVETAISRIPISQEEFKILRRWAIR